MPRFATVPARALALLPTLLVLLGVPALRADAATTSTGSIAGVAFEDLDRDRVPDAGEARLADHQLNLVDGAGALVATVLTGSDGRYRFDGVAAGSYTVEVSSTSWAPRKADWTTSTTPDWRPRHPVTVTAGAESTADFGWRRIVRSTDETQPLSTWRGPNGPLVQVYNDAVPAAAVGQLLAAGTLLGDEAAVTTIRLDLSSGSMTSASWQTANGRLGNFNALVWIDWWSWLNTTETTLFHEYGHAWAGYWSVEAQQDPSLAGYLEARGLTGDSRLDSSYGWYRAELIAEDYRQLFGSPAGRLAPQANRDIVPAAQVAGLAEYLAGAFRQPVGGGTEPAPAPEPAPALAVTDLAMSPTPVVRSGDATFTLTAPASVEVTIRDSRGRLVRTLAQGVTLDAGDASFTWDRRDRSGRSVKKGTYAVMVTATGGSDTVTVSLPFSVA